MANTARTKAIEDMLKTLKDTDQQHPFCITIAASFDRFLLYYPAEQVKISYEKLALGYHDDIRQALDDQQYIGWLHLLRDCTSLSWHHLASIKALDPTTFDTKRGEYRIQTLLHQALHTFTRALWLLGWNDGLHRTKETATVVSLQKFTNEVNLYNLFLIYRYHQFIRNPTLLQQSHTTPCRRPTLLLQQSGKTLTQLALGKKKMATTSTHWKQKQYDQTRKIATDDDNILHTGHEQHNHGHTTPATTSTSSQVHHTPENPNHPTMHGLRLSRGPTTRFK